MDHAIAWILSTPYLLFHTEQLLKGVTRNFQAAAEAMDSLTALSASARKLVCELKKWRSLS